MQAENALKSLCPVIVLVVPHLLNLLHMPVNNYLPKSSPFVDISYLSVTNTHSVVPGRERNTLCMTTT